MRLSIDAKVLLITAIISVAAFVVVLFNSIAADSSIGDELKHAYGYGSPAYSASSSQVKPPSVVIENKQFQPATIMFNTGQIVTWVNNSNMPQRYRF